MNSIFLSTIEQRCKALCSHFWVEKGQIRNDIKVFLRVYLLALPNPGGACRADIRTSGNWNEHSVAANELLVPGHRPAFNMTVCLIMKSTERPHSLTDGRNHLNSDSTGIYSVYFLPTTSRHHNVIPCTSTCVLLYQGMGHTRTPSWPTRWSGLTQK
jgi:hypothetical protein